MKIKASFEIEDETIENLLVGAIEGGSNYWYWIDKLPSNFPTNGEPFSINLFDFVWNFKGKVEVCDVESNPQKPEVLGTLSKESMINAIELISKDYPNVLSNIIEDNYDAWDSDTFFQLAVMGKVIFG